MAAPTPFSIAVPTRPRLARKLRRMIRRLERQRPDLVPVVVLEHHARSIVVMDLADCTFLRRPC